MKRVWMVVRTLARALPGAVRLAYMRHRVRIAEGAARGTANPRACGHYRYGGVTELRQAWCRNCGRLAVEHTRIDSPLPTCARRGCGHLVTSHQHGLARPGEKPVGACHLCDCGGFL